jgi:protein TonB
MKTQQADLVDIVFENRNKSYGAYAIRQRYPVNMLRSLMLCAGISMLIFILPHHPSVKDLKDVIKAGKEIYPTPPPRIKPETPEEIVPIKKTAAANIPTRITTADVPDAKFDDMSVSNSGLSDPTAGTYIESGGDNLLAIETIESPIEPPFVLFAEVMPAYEGGPAEMIKFIQKKLRYPTYAARAGITGTVYVSFVVSTNGSITHVEIVKGIDKSCDEEAMRVIALMNKWKPGMQNKMPVAIRMVLPIKFVAGE